MSSQRLSLSSPTFAGRVKKYDSYVHNSANSSRNTSRNQSAHAVESIQPKQHSSYRAQNLSVLKPTKSTTTLGQLQNSVSTHRREQISGSKIALTSVRNARARTGDTGVINRQFVDENQIVYADAKSKTSRLQKAMYVFGLLVFTFSAFTSLQTVFTNKQAQDQIATLGVRTDEQGVTEGTGNEPSEDPISSSAIASYQVTNPEDPRYIRIPALGLFSRIKSLGVDSSGAVDAPWNINDAGWYNGSARPGNAIGSSLILGHVSGWTAPGVFKNLKNLQTGAKFEIEKGSGEIVKYEVVRSESIPLDHVKMSKILGTEEAGKHDLKLMTCGGKYNREAETYEDRFVVYAKQIK